MDYSQHKAAYDRDGFTIVRQLITPAELAELKANLDRYIGTVVPTLPDAAAFYEVKGKPETLKQMQHMGDHDAWFKAYQKHPAWVGLAAALIGEEAYAEQPEWFCKPAGNQLPTPPHQDNYYFNLTPPNVLTIWMAMEPVDEANGCLRYVPGSHLRGIRPHGKSNVVGFSQGITDWSAADEAKEVPIVLAPGDVAVHHGNTIHRAEINRSTRPRIAYAMVCKGVSARRDEAGYARYTANLKKQHEELGLKT
jgi:phytanoyl-CoA hydroxylase